MQDGLRLASTSEQPAHEPGGGSGGAAAGAIEQQPAHPHLPKLLTGLSFLTLDPDTVALDSPPSTPSRSSGRSSSRTPPPRPLRSPRRAAFPITNHKVTRSVSSETSTASTLPAASTSRRDSEVEAAGEMQDPTRVWEEARRSSLSSLGSSYGEGGCSRRSSAARGISAERLAVLFAADEPPRSEASPFTSTLEVEGLTSETDSFVTADEDDGLPGSAEKKGRVSRRTSRDDFPPPMPTIADNSPIISRTLRTLRLMETEEHPMTFGYSDDDATPGEEVPSGDVVADESELPRSLRQLVRANRNLSRSSSREFTLQDEKRLSSRVAERQNDGLGLSLQMFDGSLASYTPAMRPLLTRRTTSLEAQQGTPNAASLPSTSSAGGYPFPSSPTVLSGESTSPVPQPQPSPIPRRLRSNPPSPLEPPLAPERSSSLKRNKTAPSRSRTSSSSSSPILASSSLIVQTPPASSPVSREGSPLPSPSTSRLSRRASGDDGLARPRPRTSGGLSSSKSIRRLSSVFTIGRSRSSSAGQSLQEMAEAEEQRERRERQKSSPLQPPSAFTGASLTRPSTSRHGSDDSSFITAPESSRSSPATSPSATTPSSYLPTPPRRISQPSTPSPRLASRASASSFSTSPSGTANGLTSPSPALTSSSPSLNMLSPAPLSMSTWRSTLSGQEYDALLASYGSTEMRRQEVLWELCETERLFVEGLRGVMELFALPLRREQGGWIKGVPVPIARLLDWASDIVYLHSEISSALLLARQAAPSPVVLSSAAAFLPFVVRLEIHQPYLVRFEAVTKMIDDMTADPASDFGEFVRMQSALPECKGLSLGSYLLKPVQRLMKYTLFFKQLADLTPRSHPDHLDTLALLDETDTVIRVMQEVKTREDEYEQLKAIASRLRGLPPGFQLARRDRRLIQQGQLRRVHAGDKDRQALEADGRRRSAGGARVGGGPFGMDEPPVLRFLPESSASRPQSSISDDSGSSSTGGGGGALDGDLGAWPSPLTTPDSANSRQSTFASSITAEPATLHTAGPDGFLRPTSIVSNTSSASNSDDSGNAAVPRPPPPPGAARSTPPSAFSNSAPPSAFSNTMPVRRWSKRIVKTKARETIVQVYVFSDLIVLATPKGGGEVGRWTPKMGSTRRKSVGGEEGTFKALEGIGVTRVLGVADLSGKTEHDHLIKLDLLPLSSSSERLSSLSLGAFNASSTSIFFTLPPPASSSNSSAPSTTRPSPTLDLSFQSRVTWLQAFEQSYLYAYRSLSSPSPSLLNSYIAPITQSEHLHAGDGQTSFVDRNRRNSLEATALSSTTGLGSLRTLKSPGEVYLRRFSSGGSIVEVEEEDAECLQEKEAEREERVYWAARLHKVKKEFEAHVGARRTGMGMGLGASQGSAGAAGKRVVSMGPSGLGAGEGGLKATMQSGRRASG